MKHILSIALFGAVPFVACAAKPPAAATPYTFLGRVMDAAHNAFDDSRTATVEVSDSAGRLLAKSTTFFRANSRRNYVLPVPMATDAAGGYAVTDAALEIEVTDDLGKTWSGVVVDAAAGVPGGVREVDIVLGEDLDGDGIDDDLYERLKGEWEDSDYWRAGETFDPNRDYDGDGVSTIAEALSGTNPFDPKDALRITAFAQAGTPRTRASALPPLSLTFNVLGGRAYTVEEATDLAAKDWKARSFTLPESDVPVNVLAVPSGSGRSSSTVYLLPTSDKAFFRVRSE